MRILAFSDIHFCHSWEFVTLEDIVKVHARIRAYAAEYQPQLVLFLGDRFRARQPKDHVKTAADRELRLLADVQKRHGGNVVVVVGNHDKWTESIGAGNTYSIVDVFKDVLGNVHIIDKPESLHLTSGVAIHALPAGFKFKREMYVLSPGFNIFAFHGLVHGATYDNAGEVQIKSGISVSDLDDANWDLVLGGDVHVPQILPLRKTTGGYIGSALRLTGADADDMRGFLSIELSKGHQPKHVLIDGGGPRFMKLSVHAENRNNWPSIEPFRDAVLILTVTGSTEQLRSVDDTWIHSYFNTCRKIQIHRKPDFEAPKLIQSIDASSTPFDDVVAFIHASDSNGLSSDRLINKAMAIFGAAPTRKGLFA